MRLLVRLFATSEFLSAFFLRHPEVLDSLVRADLMRIVRAREDMAAELAGRLAAAPDLESRLDTLRRFRHEEFLRVGVHDIEGTLEPAEVERQLTHLAETCLAAGLAIARREVLARAGVPDVPESEGLAVLGLGTLGGGELGYASDLDLIFVYDPGDAAWWSGRAVPHEFFTRIAERTISALATPTREGIAYRIDTRLRPSGNQGPLVSSLEAFAAYHRTGARLWERQALIKARVVAGAPAPGARPEGLRARAGRGLRLPAGAREPAPARAQPAARGDGRRSGGAALPGAPPGLRRHGRRGGGRAARRPRASRRSDPRRLRSSLRQRRAVARVGLPSPPASGYLFPMEKTERIWLDGKLVPWEAAQVHVLTHTLHYGLGVFEGIRCYQCHDGRSAVFRLREHIDRLYGSAPGLEPAMPYPPERPVGARLETVRANRLRGGYLRPIVCMGDGR